MTDESGPAYSVPAVDKALDVLEFLAATGEPVSQNQIALGTGLSVGQIFRILTVLDKRGYIGRDPQSGLYSMTLRMFRVAHQQDPIGTLVTLARSPLRQLANEIEQTCNIGYRDGDQVLIIAQAASPAEFGFQTRVGATFPVADNPSGDVFVAFETPSGPGPATTDASTLRRLAKVREQGYAELADHLHAGVTDLAVPILDRDGTSIASLTVPYVATSYSKHPLGDVRVAALRTAATLSRLLAGEP